MWRGIYIKTVIILLAGLLLPGCVHPNYSAVAEVDPAGWEANDTRSVSFVNTDTVSLRSIEAILVYDGNFRRRESPVEISVTTLAPDSLSVTESILAYPAGESAGSAIGRYRETALSYRGEVILSKSGDYIFSFSHNEPQPVKGIKAIGINVTGSLQ